MLTCRLKASSPRPTVLLQSRPLEFFSLQATNGKKSHSPDVPCSLGDLRQSPRARYRVPSAFNDKNFPQ